jgi:dihydrolipoamide dehydrogenase
MIEAMTEQTTADLVVIGAGPGGYAAAFLAADLGLDVTLVDPEINPGGVCLYRGCIPSKALLHIAKVIEESRAVAECGVTFQPPKIDLERLRTWKGEVVEKLTGGLGQLATARKVKHVQGWAKFLDAERMEVRLEDGTTSELTFRHAIVATGSTPTVLPGFPPASSRVLDSTSALDLESIPESLLVVGGGYIGLELGSVYAALGSKVTVVEMLSGLLPGADKDLVQLALELFGQRLHKVLVGARQQPREHLDDRHLAP